MVIDNLSDEINVKITLPSVINENRLSAELKQVRDTRALETILKSSEDSTIVNLKTDKDIDSSEKLDAKLHFRNRVIKKIHAIKREEL